MNVPPSGMRATILLVEDEGEVRRITERCLEAAGHRVLSAASGAEALRLAADHQGEIDLLLSDVVMPGMSGPVLAQQLRERQPTLRILFITGYADDTALRYGVDQNLVALLSKPFTAEELARRVSEVMNADVQPADNLLRSWAMATQRDSA
jgi:CheY-like chemotaxis protein